MVPVCGKYGSGVVYASFETKAQEKSWRAHAWRLNQLPRPVVFFKIEQLEEQCSEINREKEKNTELKSRIEKLESELREKETVS